MKLIGPNTVFAGMALTFAILLAGCGKSGSKSNTGTSTDPQILHLGNGTEPAGLDPHLVTGVPEYNILSALMEGLVSENPDDLSPAPGVATNWTVSNTGHRYTFHLRANSRWTSGEPLTAYDFEFSFRRILSPALASPYAYMLYVLKGAKDYHTGVSDDFSKVGVTATGPLTLELSLEAATPYLLACLNHFVWYPVHRKTILAKGKIDDRTIQWAKPDTFVGNGPFMLTSWEPHKKIVVSRNPDYWDNQTTRIDEIHFHAFDNSAAEERAFRSGQLPIPYTVPTERIAHYREQSPETIRLDPYLGTSYVLFNTGRAPLSDSRVRRALSMAIDRKKIVRYVTKAGESPAHHFTPPGAAGYDTSAAITRVVKKAKQLLSLAGYRDGEGFPELTYLYNTKDLNQRVAEVLQQMWKKALGITVRLENMEWKVYLDRTRNRDYDMARAGWIADYVDPNSFLDLGVTGGGNNRAGWANAEYDDLIAKAARTPDRGERFELFSRAEHILMRESPIAPIYYNRSKSLIDPSVRNWKPTVLDHHPYKYVYLDTQVRGRVAGAR